MIDEVKNKKAAGRSFADSDQRSPISDHPFRPWLHRYAVVLVVATFVLIILGGNVTSRGAGMAVPDWPTTFGHNMFLYPLSLWKGNVLWEHVHRLKGALVGLLCIGMAVALWLHAGQRRWLKWTGVGLLALVIVQGVMGGLRVTENAPALAVVHGITAQLFLALTVFIAAVTSRYWLDPPEHRLSDLSPPALNPRESLRLWPLVLLGVLLVQLVLGSIMRHSGSGLAIPDFPSNYGQLIPPLTKAGIHAAIDQLPYDEADTYYRPWQVWVNFAHRVWALAVVAVIVVVVTKINGVSRSNSAYQKLLTTPVTALGGLLILQLALGALVVWTGRNADMATAHQATGAALLATATLLALRVNLLTAPRPVALSRRRTCAAATAPVRRAVRWLDESPSREEAA